VPGNEARNARIRELRPTRTLQSIGDEFGLSREAIRLICLGVEGPAKKGRPTCPSCGKRVYRWGGHCRECAKRLELNRKWTTEAILSALERFELENGRAPQASDLEPGIAKRLGFPERIDYFWENDWLPHIGTVIQRFGSFNEAMRQAGLPYTEVGKYDRERRK
jgi:hypothetical protein